VRVAGVGWTSSNRNEVQRVSELQLRARPGNRGQPCVKITHEDGKRAADADGTTVGHALATIARTADNDRRDHPDEYPSKGR
jgi:hypothetical protein